MKENFISMVKKMKNLFKPAGYETYPSNSRLYLAKM